MTKSSEKEYSVYIHIFPNGKVYIGITGRDVEERWRCGEGYKGCFVYNAIKKYGWNNIKHVILFDGISKEEAENKEIELIELYDATNREKGYNIENGGNSIGKHSEKTKEKISNARKGIKFTEEHILNLSKSHMGKRHLTETKEKMSKSRMGHYVSDETRKKLSESMKGREITLEARRKISASLSGRKPKIESIEKRKTKIKGYKNPMAKRVSQYSKNGELIKVWGYMQEAADNIGIPRSCISLCCSGKQKTAGGYRWEYADK